MPDICRVSIVRDREHESLLRDILLRDDNRVLIMSHKIRPIAGTRLASWQPASNGKSSRLVARFGGISIEADGLEKMREELRPQGGELHHTPNVHAKVVATERRAIISSYNFLSSDPFGTAARAREVGILVEGGLIPKLVLEKFFASNSVEAR